MCSWSLLLASTALRAYMNGIVLYNYLYVCTANSPRSLREGGEERGSTADWESLVVAL